MPQCDLVFIRVTKWFQH